MPPGQSLQDPSRLAALAETGLLDSPIEEAFDRHAKLVRLALQCDIALVSLVDDHRQFLKSSDGLSPTACPTRQTPLSHSFCQHVVTSGGVLRIGDARKDALVADNPAVRDLPVIAYLGTPLTSEDGYVLGSLCAIMHQPREWSERDLALLEGAAAAVMSEIRLRTAGATLRDSVLALQQTARQRDEMLHMLVHDMRTPLSAVMCALDVLEDGQQPDPEQQELLEVAREAGNQLLEMINGMLTANRLEGGLHRLETTALDVPTLLRRVQRLGSPLAESSGISLSTSHRDLHGNLEADRDLLDRVLLNLVTNAIKFSPCGGAIQVEARGESHQGRQACRFIVRDQGPGIPEAEKALVFHKYRSGTNKPAGNAPSHGLGLHFCRQAVEAHGGLISVHDAPGGGSEFHVVLPCQPRPAE